MSGGEGECVGVCGGGEGKRQHKRAAAVIAIEGSGRVVHGNGRDFL